MVLFAGFSPVLVSPAVLSAPEGLISKKPASKLLAIEDPVGLLDTNTKSKWITDYRLAG